LIRLNKPDKPPKVLRKKGIEKAHEHCNDYDDGKRNFKFQDSIYQHHTVKRVLKHIQNNKCCYCERPIRKYFRDVEHYRPKSTYYWLTYDWTNLLLACPICNRQHKRDQFPLANPDMKAVSHHDDIELEEPLLINPAEDNPEEFLMFRKEVIFSVNRNIRGTKTIEALGLDKNNVEDERREIYNELRNKFILAKANPEDYPDFADLIMNAKETIRNATKASAPFAAMARTAINAGFTI